MADSYNQSNKAYRRSLMTHSIIRLIVCILLTIICLFPLYVIISNATRGHDEIINGGIAFFGGSLIKNIETINDPSIFAGFFVNQFRLWDGYRNSLIVAGLSTVFTVFFSGMTAYGLVVYDFKGKGFFTNFILAVMMVPMQVVSTGFLQFMFQLNLVGGPSAYIALILPSIAAPAVVFYMLQYMRSSFPLEIVEAARIDGCGEFRTFMQIALPIFKPAFAVQAIFAFVTSWNNYYTPSMLLGSADSSLKTIPMMVQAVLLADKLSDNGAKYLVITLSILPVIIIYLLLSKFIVKGVALGAVKG
ncbi:MAG: carbohydrate ABC transporter permease [Oscillospiraceae bacterium]|nr:carbohydrate ABC transporter permease [Oscillospiraceae bacterium]